MSATITAYRLTGLWQDSNEFQICPPEGDKICVIFLLSYPLYFCTPTTGKSIVKMIKSNENQLPGHLTSK